MNVVFDAMGTLFELTPVRERLGALPRGGHAVFDGRRERMLGREPVLDARHSELRILGELPQEGVLQVGGAERPAPAVQMEVRPTRRIGHEHPHAYIAPLLPPRVRQEHGRGEETATVVSRASRQRCRH